MGKLGRLPQISGPFEIGATELELKNWFPKRSSKSTDCDGAIIRNEEASYVPPAAP